MSALTVMTKNEGRLFLREPAAVFWSLPFPIGLLVIFGLIPAFRNTDPDTGLRLINVYTPTLLLMTMTFLAVSGLPTTLTTYRERLVLKRLATTPVGRSKMLAAQLLVNLAFARAATLSPRETEVPRLIANGSTNREAAETLYISETTIKTHLLHVYEKLGVRDRAAAVGEAYKRGLLN